MPTLSIGLPIYNGDNFGEHAIRSLLAQTYTDFELIIADNASTDRTAEICRSYAAQDPRIRYFRHAENMGAAYNFNFAFAQASGRYFKWASHDDVLAPAYLARCVEALDRDEAMVLSHTRTNLIDAQGAHLEDDNYPMRLASDRAHERFRDLSIIRHDCFLVFGVIRRDALQQTPLIGNYVGSDRVLLCELALHGKFFEAPEFLFSRRRHSGTSCDLSEREERVAWFDPTKAGTITYPNWRILQECAAAIQRAPQPAATKLRCHLQIPEQVWTRRRFLSMDVSEGLKMSLKRTAAGRRLFEFLKRTLRPGTGS